MKSSPLGTAPKKELTLLQRIRIIESAIEELRPYLKADGGDCELVDVDGDRVMVKLSGACVGCQARQRDDRRHSGTAGHQARQPAARHSRSRPLNKGDSMRPVYLDNNATTRVDPKVVSAMLPFFTEQFGNASSMHAFGSEVGAALKRARRQLQALLGAEFDHEIVYTGSGTESDNTAILSALETQPGRDEIVTSHGRASGGSWRCANGCRRTAASRCPTSPVDSRGRLDIDAYRKALGPKTAIASIMWANNETGTIFPVEQLADLAHDAGALFHTDAVQAVGKVPMDLKTSEIDMLSLSGHKLHAPKGIGALYVRRGVRLRPLLRGGHQERGRRASTENAPGIVGLGVAAELALEHMADEQTRVARVARPAGEGLAAAYRQRLRHRRCRKPPAQHQPTSRSSSSKARVSCCC